MVKGLLRHAWGPAWLYLLGLPCGEEDQRIQGMDRHLGQLGKRRLGHSLLQSAKVLTHNRPIPIQASSDLDARDGWGRIRLVGEEAELRPSLHLLRQPLHSPPMDAQERDVLPGLNRLGEGPLHGTDVGQDLQRLSRHVAQERPSDPKKVWVAGGQDNDPLLPATGCKPSQYLVHLAADPDSLGLDLKKEIKQALPARENLGLTNNGQRSRGEARPPLIPHTDHLNRFSHGLPLGDGSAQDGPVSVGKDTLHTKRTLNEHMAVFRRAPCHPVEELWHHAWRGIGWGV